MCGQQGFHLFSVCDGHGVNGHKVSADIKAELPKQIEMKLKVDADFIEMKETKELKERIPKYFRESFQVIHEGLYKKNYDVHLSGSTVTAILFDG